jgi:F5/8 type C domain
MIRRSFLLVLAAFIALAATAAVAFAGGGRGSALVARASSVTVKPFADVQASDMVFERDASDPSRGIFRVTTSEPMICAIVWGPDRKLGRFNNSLAMNGTGIAQHDVILPKVKGGVRYFYVVQGTTADGTLYRSKVGRFELPKVAKAAAGVAGAENVALGAKVVDVSSEFSEAFAAANAIDGRTSTEWASKGDGDRGFITLDLGSTTKVVAVEFLTRSMADGSAVTNRYTISGDGGAPLGPFPAGTVADPRPSKVDVSARTLRFDITSSTGGNVGAVEIRVYAAA